MPLTDAAGSSGHTSSAVSKLSALSGMVAIVYLAAFVCTARGGSDVGLLPDVSFSVDCSANPLANFDDQVNHFMTAQGFHVVDVGKEVRQKGADVFPHSLTGIDDHDRSFNLVSFPRQPSHASFSLFSRPPTRHDAKLEAAVQELFSSVLECGVSRVETYENGVEAQEIFERQVVRKGLLRDGL